MKQGFTLIELLAVIVILAIIALIATPIVLNIIKDTKESALLRSAEYYLDGVNYAISSTVLKGKKIEDGIYNIMPSGNICLGTLSDETCIGELLEIQVKGQKPNGHKIVIKDSQVVSHVIKYDEFIVQSENYVFSPKELQELYEFKYYSSLRLAINDVNNNRIGENSVIDKESAVAGIYIYHDKTHVVLLKNSTEVSKIEILTDMIINLGGNVLSVDDTYGISIVSGDVTIDGRLDGSVVQVYHEDGRTSRTIRVEPASNSNVTIIGGTYIAQTNSGNAVAVSAYDTANLELSDATIISNGSGNTVDIRGVQISPGATGVISNCDIKAYSNYLPNDEVTAYVAVSMGVLNGGTLTINDCYIMGVHCGISNVGTLYVNGGIYEGFGHGGFYFSGYGTTAYVRNATIRECDMPDGYTTQIRSNYAGFYIGGDSSAHNNTVYMDNCDIYGNWRPIVLRGTDGEVGSTLYISNSRINLDYTQHGIRNDNSNLKVYIGKNCNFGKEDAKTPEAVIQTNEIYIND